MTGSMLEQARAGDDRAFGALVEPHRAELRVHCYRMLGSLTDAEDAVQETMAAAWKGIGGFEGRASIRTWLYRIATNRCLNVRRDAARRRPAEPVPPFDPVEPNGRSEVTWLQPLPAALLEEIEDRCPGPEARYVGKEAVELAFITGLQLMPPRQAAALVLRDVLSFSQGEVADMIGTSPTALKGLLQRARASLDKHRDEGTVHIPDSHVDDDVPRRFAEAFADGRIEDLVELLTDDAWLTMPPASHEYRGVPAVAQFLEELFAWRGDRPRRLLPATANGQPAFGCYLAEVDRSFEYRPSLIVLTLRGDRISTVTQFLGAAPMHRFGLPETLDG